MICMANPGGFDLDQNLICQRLADLDWFQIKISFAIRDGSPSFHAGEGKS